MADPLFGLHSLLAVTVEPRAGESAGATTLAAPFTPALIVGLCVAAGIATWLALPSRRELSIRRIGLVALVAIGLVLAGLLVRWTVDYGGMGVYFWLFSAVALFASVRVITHTKPVYSALYFVLTVFATGGLFVLLWAEFIAAALVLIYAGAILITYVFVIMLASEATTGGGADSSKLVTDHDANSRDPFLAAMTGFAVTGLLIYLIFDLSNATSQAGSSSALASADRTADLLKEYQSPGNGLSWQALSQRQTVLKPDGHVDWSAAPAQTKTAELDNNLGSSQALGVELIDHQALNVQLAGVILTVAMVGAITLARRRVLVSGPPGGHETVTTPATPVDDNPKTIAVYGTDNPRHKAYPEN